MVAIGIDLGTTFCCIAIYRDKKVEIIPNELGKYTTPSYVAFTKNEVLVGESAKKQTSKNVKNTIYNIKRIIGRKQDDQFLRSCIKKLPFKTLICDGRTKIEVQLKEKTKRFYPEEITAMLLKQLKSTAENYLNDSVSDAVITVPAAFDNNQRQCTVDAANIAGLNVLRLLNEPTAAAIAYGLDQSCADRRNILVYDLGGGTFDVSILRKCGSELTVLNSVGDPNLGGEDFDSLLLNYCADEFVRLNDCDPRTSDKSVSRLRNECEYAKQCLSSSEEYEINLSNLCADDDFSYRILRKSFNEMCKNHFERTIDILKRAITDVNLKIEDIDDVVLTGGSTRIPCIHEMIRSFFKGKDIQTKIDADQSVAHGAAIYAHTLCLSHAKCSPDLFLIEKTFHSLGIKVAGGKMEVLIPRSTRYPYKKTKMFSTNEDGQSEVHVSVYEGESSLVAENNHLGTFTISGIPPAPKREHTIEITFDVDLDGIIKVSGKLSSMNKEVGMVIEREQNVLSDKEKKRIKAEFEEIRQAEAIEEKRIAAMTSLQTFSRNKLDDANTTEELKSLCSSTNAWLEENQNLGEAELLQKLSTLRSSFDSSP